MTFDPFDPLRRDADRLLKGILGVREAPLEMLRRDLERVKTVAANPPTNPLGNPFVRVRLEEEIHQYLLDQQRPQESISQTIARLTGERLWVEENLLTPVEHQVLRLAAEGLKSWEIAATMGMRLGTVRVHLSDIRRRIGVDTTGEAVALLGKPTARKRIPFAEVRAPLTEEEREARRAPSLLTQSYERRAATLLTLVDEIEKDPSMEKVGRLEKELLDLEEKVGSALALAPSGVDQVRLGFLRGRLEASIRVLALVRTAIDLMERETLPLRIKVARGNFLAAIRILREDFPVFKEVTTS